MKLSNVQTDHAEMKTAALVEGMKQSVLILLSELNVSEHDQFILSDKKSLMPAFQT